MYTAEKLDLDYGVCQPCPGVWYYPEVPQDMLDRGLLLSKSDFHEATQITGQHFKEGTYAYNQLIISLEARYRDLGSCYTDTWYDLKNPHSRRADSYYVETQVAHDILRRAEAGERVLMGYGPKTLGILAVVLYDGAELTFI